VYLHEIAIGVDLTAQRLGAAVILQQGLGHACVEEEVAVHHHLQVMPL
jgi:hypothetical protein